MKSATVYCDGTVVGNDNVVLTDVVSVDCNVHDSGAPYCGTITLAVTEKIVLTQAKYTPTPTPQPIHPDSARLMKVKQMLADARLSNEISAVVYEMIASAAR